MGTLILVFTIVSLGGCITYSVRFQDDHTPFIRATRGFLVGIISAIGLTMFYLIVRAMISFI